MLMLILLYVSSFIGVVFAWGWLKEIKAYDLLQQERDDLRQELKDLRQELEEAK